ncbi:hypothetical protein AVEN_136966-1 [Araneus ventricosus]|uniref:Uncharacterized protein n=1 Tax=Araneus ventricosus TaxID=182803 RepID=A0A4Y2BIE9_ARAVE|nr:hypothetical protein AVEN_136966-1 [Araneus ventricosus]
MAVNSSHIKGGESSQTVSVHPFIQALPRDLSIQAPWERRDWSEFHRPQSTKEDMNTTTKLLDDTLDEIFEETDSEDYNENESEMKSLKLKNTMPVLGRNSYFQLWSDDERYTCDGPLCPSSHTARAKRRLILYGFNVPQVFKQ